MSLEKRALAELVTTLGTMQTQQAQPVGASVAIQESLDNVRALLAREDRDWALVSGGGSTEEGLTLDDLKEWSEKLREYAAANPLGKRGFALRHGFINKGSLRHDGIPKETRGNGSKASKYIKHPLNQRNFFGPEARRKKELALYTDGIALWLGNDSDHLLTPIPIDQISAYMTDPDFPGVIWAYRRKWKQRQRDGKMKSMVKWYAVDFYKDQVTDEVKWGGKWEEVDKDFTAFDMHANPFDGWPLGIPDALAAWIWAGIVKSLYSDGIDVSAAMASFAFKATTATKGAGANASVQMASPLAAGSTAVMGAGNDLAVLSSAGKGYDFKTIREIISMVATSLDVATMALTNNTADAGSSYGSAAALDEPGRLTMTMRREEHIALEERVLRWMGAEDATAYYEPFEDGSEVYRRLQAVTLPFLQGVIGVDKYKELAADALGVPDLGETPAGVLLPNNKDSLPRRDIDRDGAGGSASTAAPTQGKSSGLDDSASAQRDTRTDTIS